MGLFGRKTPEQRMKEMEERFVTRREEERQAMLAAGWIDKEEQNELWNKLKELEAEYCRPTSAIRTYVFNDTDMMPSGGYDVWRYQSDLVFSEISSEDRKQYAEFPADNPEDLFRFVSIDAIAGVEEEGERTERTEIVSARLFGKRKRKFDTKDVVKDNRKAFIVVKSGDERMKMQIPISTLDAIRALLPARQEEKSVPADMEYMQILTNLKDLFDKGILTQDEFEKKKTEILARI